MTPTNKGDYLSNSLNVAWIASLIKMEFLANLLNQPRHPQTKNYFLLDSPIPVTIIIFSYLILARIVLPKFMKNREAFNTSYVTLGLNIYFVSAAFYFSYKCIKIDRFRRSSWNCAPSDKSNSEEASEV